MILKDAASLRLDRLEQELAAFESWQAEEGSRLLALQQRGVGHEFSQCCTQGRQRYFRKTCAFQACRREAERRRPTREYGLHCEEF
jgi:hypothetical protein